MKNPTQAFTRIELLAVCTALALLALIVAPALATNKTDAERVACFNNLRQIGGAVRQWAGEHKDQSPWITPVSDGGTKPVAISKTGAAWLEFATLSNQLITPRILSCPSDPQVKVASEWGSGANGLANTGFRQNAISYFLAIHGFSDRPASLIAGDRNLAVDYPGPADCSYTYMNNVAIIEVPFSETTAAWTNDVHGMVGHLLLTDGSVHFLDSKGLRAALKKRSATDYEITHLLPAR